MEAIRKQASKLREQVAKQQQAVLKQLGHFGNDGLLIDETELQCYHQLQSLYNSTRTAKHFQRHIVRGVEGFISLRSKQMEIVRRLADDCCKYGVDNQTTASPLSKAALHFGNSHNSLEKETETLLGILGDQVTEPLRAQINGAPLEDARHLTRRYDKLRQEVESQAGEVLKRQSKSKESAAISTESSMRLQSAEARLSELKSTMVALGKEASAAMLSVEDQQQQMTFQKLLVMVNAERSYHQSVLGILDKLNDEMVLEEQANGARLNSISGQRDTHADTHQEDSKRSRSDTILHLDENITFFLAKVIHPFDAQADGELNLSVDDYVVVRQVGSNGWSEGECKGKAGWFPSAYIQRQEQSPASKSDIISLQS